MIRVTDKTWPIRLIFLGIAVALLLTTVTFARERGPEELRGKVTAVKGDRIHISLSQREWLPRAGTSVELGAEMAGMFVPLKGSFVIIQVNADSCIAKAVGNEEHGKPATGMAAVMKTPYPNHPQSRTDYLGGGRNTRQTEKAALKMAEGGNKPAQLIVAMGDNWRGDHDNALVWWERSSNGSNERAIISMSATGRAKILAIRGEFQKALAILQDAASRTAPRAGEMNFGAYTLAGAGVKFHVDVLENLGSFYRTHLDNIDEANRWYRAATKVMAACATNGAPEPGQPTYLSYQGLLSELAILYMWDLKDEEAAVPWLQSSARAGDKNAQRTLSNMNRSW